MTMTNSPHIATLAALLVCTLACGSVVADDTHWVVRAYGNGEMIGGPFTDYFEAEAFARRWSWARPNDLRIAMPKEEKKSRSSRSPIDLLLAGGVSKVAEILDQTKQVAEAAGMEIPSTGDVLGEYNESIERGYSGAKAVREGASEALEKGSEELFGALNAALDKSLKLESDAFIAKQESELARIEMESQAKTGKEQQLRVNEVLDKIANATDPKAQAALIEELQTLQSSGELRKAAVAKAQDQIATSVYAAKKQRVDDLEASVIENGKLQLEIVNSIRKKAAPDIEDLVGDWGYYTSNSNTGARYFRKQFTIKPGGTAIGYGYYSNAGRGRATLNGRNLTVTTNGDWGGFQGRPYLKWELTYEDGELIGDHSYMENTTDGRTTIPTGWSSPSSTKLQRE
jgi:hypothetical protein